MEQLSSSVRVVLALRADFLDRLGPFSELARAVEKRIQLVTDMQPEELRRAIEEPALRHGVIFEPDLVDTIVREVHGQAGALPLLQYTLDRLWAAEREAEGFARARTLQTTTYRRLGGVRGALEKRAEAIYAALGGGNTSGSSERDLMRQIFLRLVDIASSDRTTDASTRPVRRRVPMVNFRRAAEQQLLRELIDQKLLVSSREVSGGVGGASGATVEVAHEAIFGCWGRLSTWIADTRQLLFLQSRLAEDERRWNEVRRSDRRGDAEDELWAGLRLDQALEMRARGDFEVLGGGLPIEQGAFLDASERARRRRRTAASRRRRTAFVAVCTFLGVALIGLVYSNWLREQAKQAQREALSNLEMALAQAAEAQRERRNSLARQLYRDAELEFGPSAQSLTTSARLAVASLTNAWTFDAFQLLLDRSQLLPPRPRISWTAHDTDVSAIAIPAAELSLATATPGEVAVWSLAPGSEGTLRRRLRPQTESLPLSRTRPPPFAHLVYSLDGRWLAGDCGPFVCLWESPAFSLRTISLGAAEISALAFSADGRRLAVGRRHDSTLLVDVAHDEHRLELPDEDSFSLAFSPDGARLFTASERGLRTIRVRPQGADVPRDIKSDGGRFVLDGAGERLAVTDPLGVFVWSASGHPARSGVALDRAGESTAAMSFSPSGEHLVTSPAAQLWDLRGSPKEELRFVDREALVRFAGADTLVSASGRNVALLSFRAARGEMARLEQSAPARGVDFSEDNRHVATADDRGLSIFELTDASWVRVASVAVSSGAAGVRISANGRLAVSWHHLRLSLVDRRREHPPIDWGGAPNEAIQVVAISPDGAMLALAAGDDVEVIRAQPPYERLELPAQSGSVGRMGFSPDGRWLATSTRAQCVSGVLERPGVTAVYDVGDGRRLAWTSNEAEDARSSECGGPAKLQPGTVGKGGDTALLEPAARWLVEVEGQKETRGRWSVQNLGRSVSVIDVESRRKLALVHHDGVVTDIDLSADGRWLATASDDATVRLWSLRAEDVIRDVCSRLPPAAPGYGVDDHALVCSTNVDAAPEPDPTLSPGVRLR